MSNTKISQHEATVKATLETLSANGITFDNTVPVKGLLTKQIKAQINTKLESMFNNNEVVLSAGFDSSKIKTYVPQLVSNWVKKSTKLNGNVKYVATVKRTTDSTTVATTTTKVPKQNKAITKILKTDAQLTSLNKLMTICETEEEKAELQERINDRIATLTPTTI